ncbi:MAG: hypothetical protein ABW221_21675 [Vicinamibacteria bacterium]
MPRTALLLRSTLAVLLAGAATSAADHGPKEISFRDFGSDGSTALVGHVGLPIGQVVRLEGRRAPNLKTTNAATLEVVRVNGQEPRRRQPDERIHIQVHNVEALPPNETIVLEGFEFASWVGAPTNWFLRVEFQVTNVVSPSAIVLKQRGPQAATPRPLEIATADLAWRLRVDFSGAVHAQYGSAPGDGGFVPPGTIDRPALARALSAAAGGGAPKGPHRLQATASWFCPEDVKAAGCDWRSEALGHPNEEQERILRRLLEELEPQWKPDEYGTRRFEELRRTHPILPRD